MFKKKNVKYQKYLNPVVIEFPSLMCCGNFFFFFCGCSSVLVLCCIITVYLLYNYCIITNCCIKLCFSICLMVVQFIFVSFTVSTVGRAVTIILLPLL